MSGSFPSLPPGGWQGDNAQLQQYLPQYCQWLRQQGASEEQVKEAACQIDPQAWASLQFGQPGVVGPPTGKSDMFHPSQPPMDQNGTGRCTMVPRQEAPYHSSHTTAPISSMPSVNKQSVNLYDKGLMPLDNVRNPVPLYETAHRPPVHKPYDPSSLLPRLPNNNNNNNINSTNPNRRTVNEPQTSFYLKQEFSAMRRPYGPSSSLSVDCAPPSSTKSTKDVISPHYRSRDFLPGSSELQRGDSRNQQSLNDKRYQYGLSHSESSRSSRPPSYSQSDKYRNNRYDDDRRPGESDHRRSSRDSPSHSRPYRSQSRDSTRSGSSHYSSKSSRPSSSSSRRCSSSRSERHRDNEPDHRSGDHRSSSNKTKHDSYNRLDQGSRSPSYRSSSRSEASIKPIVNPESGKVINVTAKLGSENVGSVNPGDIVRSNRACESSRSLDRRRSRSSSRDRRHLRRQYSHSTESLKRTNHSPYREKSKRDYNDKEYAWTTEKDDLQDISKEDFLMEDEKPYPEAEEDFDFDKMEEADVCLWVRCSPAELYYQRDPANPSVLVGTQRLTQLQDRFRSELLTRAVEAEAKKPPYEMPPRKIRLKKMKSPSICGKSSSSSSSCNSESSESEEDTALEELERKKKHPYRLHPELWYNDPGEMNDGPLCRCSAKAQRSGIRHGIYPGEEHLTPCDLGSNNAHRLNHYRVTMSPDTNFLSKFPTLIKHDSHEFIFEGFSMFSHGSLSNLPPCRVIRFNIEYTVLYLEESFPENFTVEGLDLFSQFLFHDILELVDLEWRAHNDNQGCQRFHFMPRFARTIEDGGKELLSLNVVLQHLLTSNDPLVSDPMLESLTKMSQPQWQDWADQVKGMVVTQPGMKPCSLRVDQLDREQCLPGKSIYPEIIHFGIRPPQLSYAGNPSYQKAWRSYVKFRHLLANKPKVEYADRHKLLQKEMKLQEMRMKSNLKRDVTVVISSKDFKRTGIMCDIVQHALLLPVLVCHLRLHQSLDILEMNIGHPFKDRWLLQLALTHPSYRENFGTNPDHARNSLTNCGIRQPEYGDRRIHYMNTRKRGINTLINIMSRFGKREETLSHINHNERLEFLGDAVVEFLSSIHLFYMFPDLEEGGLATYRAAIVQNQHLAVLAKKLQLEKFMLYAHGSDLCHDLELRHAMANCFEALMGALFLDEGICVADKVFSETLFSEPELLDVWVNYPPHPLQEQELHGDRKWIESVPLLKELHKFEDSTGIEFTHIRLLARAFTHRSVGFNNLTLGSNQRLEFLGDTVLQLVASEYLYKFFPEHHEGHLSLLRSSLVNNRTQSVVCDDLGMAEFAIYPHPKGELKTKDKADLLEAFLGSLYVDKDLEYCRSFCQVCFFPRLQPFIMNQDWNDPKSKLQQCCLTLRSMDGGEPDIPVYKVIECKGPTNTRVYTVAVYFRGERLATGSGHSIQQAEMAAAGNALDSSKHLFPQLNHQKRVIERSVKQQVPAKSSRSKKKARRKKK